MSLSLLDYSRQQQQRLQALRAEAERERALLSHRRAISVTPHSDSPDKHPEASPVPRRGDSLDSMAAPSRDAAVVRHLRQQLGAVLDRIEQLRRAESEIDAELQMTARKLRESECHSIHHKRIEDEAKTLEMQASERELALEKRLSRDRDTLTAEESALRIVSLELAERHSMLAQACRKAESRAADNDALLHRHRETLKDAEDRLHAIESQLIARQQELEIAEREMYRSEMEFQDDEVRAMEQLRREIAILSAHVA